MLGLNAVALVFFGCIYVAAYQLCKRPEGRRRKTVRTLCAVLLCGNLLRYCVVYPFVKGVVMLPVEFSTVAYFAVPMILLTGRKKLHSWAAFSAGIKSSTANFPPPGPEAGGTAAKPRQNAPGHPICRDAPGRFFFRKRCVGLFTIV